MNPRGGVMKDSLKSGESNTRNNIFGALVPINFLHVLRRQVLAPISSISRQSQWRVCRVAARNPNYSGASLQGISKFQ